MLVKQRLHGQVALVPPRRCDYGLFYLHTGNLIALASGSNVPRPAKPVPAGARRIGVD
jgi:hypothetical protein